MGRAAKALRGLSRTAMGICRPLPNARGLGWAEPGSVCTRCAPPSCAPAAPGRGLRRRSAIAPLKACARRPVRGRQALAFDEQLEHFVQHGVGRQAVHIALARGQFRRRLLVDDGLRDQLAPRLFVDMARRSLLVLYGSPIRPRPPLVSPYNVRRVGLLLLPSAAGGRKCWSIPSARLPRMRACRFSSGRLRQPEAGFVLPRVAATELGNWVGEQLHAGSGTAPPSHRPSHCWSSARAWSRPPRSRAQRLRGQCQRECAVDAARAAHHHLLERGAVR